MEDQQGPIIVVLIVALIVAFGVALYFSGDGGGGQSGLDSNKRFVAKPGTRRDNALALTSKKRDLDAEPSGGGLFSGPGGGDTGYGEAEPVPEEERIKVRSLSDPGEEEDLTEEEREIRSALNSLDPEQGLAKLETLLESGVISREHAAEAHMAMGLLHVQKSPPDFAASDAAMDRALEEAPSRELRQEVARNHASLLMARGANTRAQTLIEGILAEKGPGNVVEGRLRVMLGQLHEAEGNTAAAEEAYRAALQQVATLPTADAEEQSDVLRLAGLQLSRLYHTTGRSEEARNVVDQLEASLPEK
jgi:tetratricopeptide (TPR) repeat protein